MNRYIQRYIYLKPRRTSLVIQWLRICLPTEGTWVQSLVQEDPTCHRATKPVCHNYSACAVEPTSCNYWSLCAFESELCNERSPLCIMRSPRITTGEIPCAVTKTSTASQSVSQFSRSVVSDSLWPHELQHTRPPCPSPTPGVLSDSRPLSQWCHPAISSSVVTFSSCLQSFPTSGFIPMRLFLKK